ncbi:hypothetical protein LXA43DRAFT_1069291 [Ganoderma leucocontextum]|nr:hypothetical protein LXA43DRAFT_1069291 [Ganoderma leucocontextum]
MSSASHSSSTPASNSASWAARTSPSPPRTLLAPLGCIFVTVRGYGAYQLPLNNPFATWEGVRAKLTIATFMQETLNSLESVEKAHAKLSFNQRVGQVLGVTRAPTRMDSQTKYCSLARGDGGVYLRMPVGTGYREKIWDQAAGAVFVEEADGVISD